jgi:ribosomal protein L19
MINPIIDELEKNYKKSEIPQMNPCDTVKVSVRIFEGNK